MCKEQDELISIIDEIAGAAASMNQNPQNYEAFIRTRELGIKKINEFFTFKSKVVDQLSELNKIICR